MIILILVQVQNSTDTKIQFFQISLLIKTHNLFTLYNDKHHETFFLEKDSNGAIKDDCLYETGILYKIMLLPSKALILYDSNNSVPLSKKTLDLLNPLAKRFGISIHQQYTNLKLQSGFVALESELLKYRSVVNNVSEGLVILDTDFRIVFANEYILDKTENKINEVIGKSIFNIRIEPSKRSLLKAMTEKAIAGKEIKFILEHTKKHSKEKWWADIKISPYKNELNKTLGVIAIIRDVTTEKKVEKNLKDSLERLDKLFNLTPIPILIRSIDSLDFKIVNKKFTELFGYTVEELRGLKRKDLVHHEDQVYIKSEMQKLLDGEISVFRAEKQYIKKDKSIFWGAATRSLVKFEDETLLIGFIEDITEQKEATAALKASEAKIRAIIDSSGDKILALDREFRLIDYNKAAKKFFKKFNSNSFKLNEVFEPKGKDVKPLWKAHFEKALEGKEATLTRKYNFENKDRVDLVNILPIKNENQEVIGITVHGKEITEITNIQQALQISENRLKAAQRIAKIGNWELDLSTLKMNLSSGLCKIFKLPGDQLSYNASDLKSLVDPNEIKGLEYYFLNAIQEGRPFEFEVKAFTTEMEPIQTFNKVEIQYKDGQPNKIFGTVQDISTLKNIQLKLEESNKKYKDLFDNMYDAMMTVGNDGRFIHVNEAAQRLTEYTVEELSKLRIQDIVHPDDMAKTHRYLDLLYTEGFYSNYQGRIITKFGKEKYVQINSNAIIKEGKVIGSRDIVRDITALKLAEKKRELLYTQLELANKELKDFAYIVSHDLKAPLRAISSLSNWIAEDYMDLFDDEGKKHLNLLIGRADRMQKFIEGILQYSRIGRVQLEKYPVNINQLIDEVIEDLSPPSHFNLIIDENIPEIKCEKIRIRQVFQNLIGNAIKYNDKKIGIIKVSYEDSYTHHKFIVADNGPGIEEKHFDKIFKIFQTLQSKDQLESTGIGLTIVKRIVELHNGKIWINSLPGQGSSFIFNLQK